LQIPENDLGRLIAAHCEDVRRERVDLAETLARLRQTRSPSCRHSVLPFGSASRERQRKDRFTTETQRYTEKSPCSLCLCGEHGPGVAGFGIGTLLTPLFALRYDTKLAVAIVDLAERMATQPALLRPPNASEFGCGALV
jgi:hypothetical protein